MSHTLVRRAFEVALQNWANAQSPVIPVAWQNLPFTPPAPAGANTRYVRAAVLPASPGLLDLGGTLREYLGIFHVRIWTPAGIGAGAAEAIAQSLAESITPAAPLVADTLKVYLTAPFSPSPALDEPDGLVMPVTAPYRAFA
jgi:hypothetical protein